MTRTRSSLGRCLSIVTIFFMVLGVCAPPTSALVPEDGSIGILTRTAAGAPVPGQDVRVRQISGNWPQPTIYDATNPAGTLWVAVLPGTYEVAALDADTEPLPGAVTVFVPSGAHDVIVVLIVPEPCFGDFDDSTAVGFGDLLSLLGAWGPCLLCEEDLDDDGQVGFADLLLLLGAWGPCPGDPEV